VTDSLTEDVFDDSADVVVVGGGAAGFAAAVTAVREGASAILLERAEEVGGTTALSGGGVWIPNNYLMRAEGLTDPKGPALQYMARLRYRHMLPGRSSDARFARGRLHPDRDLLRRAPTSAGRLRCWTATASSTSSSAASSHEHTGHAETLARSEISTWRRTDAGDIDVLADIPAGAGVRRTYDDLLPRSARLDAGGVVVAVANLEDVIKSKE